MRCLLVVACLCGTASAGSAPDLAFARGNVLLAAGDDAGALVAFDEVVDRFPASPHAAEAALRALDIVNRGQRFDELVVRVDALMNDRPLLRRNRAFARDLRKIFMRCCLRIDVAPPPTDWEHEALERLAEFADHPAAPFGDELLYEAGWQFYVSDHPDAAARAWRVLIAVFPHSALVPRARIGLADF